MGTLISPGVDVQIIDESFYIPGRAACVPLIFIATADEKFQVDGVSPAVGTYENNVMRTVTSLKQSLELYGVPKFHRSATGQPHHGDARNEYGLDALNKFLEIGNRAYVIRANVNLNDDLADIKTLWVKKIQAAADYLNELVQDWLDTYNTVNNFFPADVADYKTQVDAATLKELIDQALTDVFSSYSFQKPEFRDAFLLDHTNPQPAYQRVLTETYAGFVVAGDVTGYEDGQVYGAIIDIVGDPEDDNSAASFTASFEFNGEDIITFGDLVDAMNVVMEGYAVAEIIQGAIKITSTYEGATSEVTIVSDGQSSTLPLFASLNLFDRIEDPKPGYGADSLAIYTDDYNDFDIIGDYDGLYSIIDDWTSGTPETTEFSADDAEGLLLAAADMFDNTKEFVEFSKLGDNDAARRATIVTALQAAVNNPFNGSRNEWIEYNITLAPGYPELADELLRLDDAMNNEVFIIGETPFDKPPTGPNSIAQWAVTPARKTKQHIAYHYGHGISSNIDGNNIMTSAGSTALRVFAYNDDVQAEWYAPAGVQRGTCSHLSDIGYASGTLGGPTTFVSEYLDTGTRDDLYEFPKNINPISFIPGRGILVMGQKTTYGAFSALDRINVVRLTKFIKRQLRKALFAYLFEPNDRITWDLVKAACDGFLGTLIGRRALYDFAVLIDTDNNTPFTIDNNELHVDIAIKPVKAIEFIYVKVRVVNTGANIGTSRTGSSFN
jgi:hypothetical protein